MQIFESLTLDPNQKGLKNCSIPCQGQLVCRNILGSPWHFQQKVLKHLPSQKIFPWSVARLRKESHGLDTDRQNSGDNKWQCLSRSKDWEIVIPNYKYTKAADDRWWDRHENQTFLESLKIASKPLTQLRANKAQENKEKLPKQIKTFMLKNKCITSRWMQLTHARTENDCQTL